MKRTVLWLAALVATSASTASGCSSGNDPPAQGGGRDGGSSLTDAGPAGAVVSDNSIEFGLVPCGDAGGRSKTFTVKNQGGSTLTWSAAFDATALFEVTPAAGELDPGKSDSITLKTKALPPTLAAGAVTASVLRITTNDETHPLVGLRVSLTPSGASLTVTPSPVDFGQAAVGVDDQDIPVTLTNSGNASAEVAIGAPSANPFKLVWTGAPAQVELAAGASVPALVAKFKPSAVGGITATSTLTVTGVVCAGSAKTIALRGQGQ